MNPLKEIWLAQQEVKKRKSQEALRARGWANDLRWSNVYGYVKLIDEPYALYEVLVTVLFDGQRYTSKIRVDPADGYTIEDILDECVEAIDELMENSGVPPYKIRSHS